MLAVSSVSYAASLSVFPYPAFPLRVVPGQPISTVFAIRNESKTTKILAGDITANNQSPLLSLGASGINETNNCEKVLLPEYYCYITVRFKPGVTGVKQFNDSFRANLAKLTFYYASGNSPTDVTNLTLLDYGDLTGNIATASYISLPNIYIALANQGIAVSSDSGKSFTLDNSLQLSDTFKKIVSFAGKIYALSQKNGLYMYDADSQTWRRDQAEISNPKNGFTDLVVTADGRNLFIVSNNTIYVAQYSSQPAVFKTIPLPSGLVGKITAITSPVSYRILISADDVNQAKQNSQQVWNYNFYGKPSGVGGTWNAESVITKRLPLITALSSSPAASTTIYVGTTSGIYTLQKKDFTSINIPLSIFTTSFRQIIQSGDQVYAIAVESGIHVGALLQLVNKDLIKVKGLANPGEAHLVSSNRLAITDLSGLTVCNVNNGSVSNCNQYATKQPNLNLSSVVATNAGIVAAGEQGVFYSTAYLASFKNITYNLPKNLDNEHIVPSRLVHGEAESVVASVYSVNDQQYHLYSFDLSGSNASWTLRSNPTGTTLVPNTLVAMNDQVGAVFYNSNSGAYNYFISKDNGSTWTEKADFANSSKNLVVTNLYPVYGKELMNAASLAGFPTIGNLPVLSSMVYVLKNTSNGEQTTYLMTGDNTKTSTNITALLQKVAPNTSVSQVISNNTVTIITASDGSAYTLINNKFTALASANNLKNLKIDIYGNFYGVIPGKGVYVSADNGKTFASFASYTNKNFNTPQGYTMSCFTFSGYSSNCYFVSSVYGNGLQASSFNP